MARTGVPPGKHILAPGHLMPSTPNSPMEPVRGTRNSCSRSPGAIIMFRSVVLRKLVVHFEHILCLAGY